MHLIDLKHDLAASNLNCMCVCVIRETVKKHVILQNRGKKLSTREENEQMKTHFSIRTSNLQSSYICIKTRSFAHA